MRLDDVRRVSELHAVHMANSVFAKLGLRFLQNVYRSLLTSCHAVAFVCEANDEMVGFIAASTRSSILLRHAFLTRFHELSILVPIALIRRPWLVKDLMQTLKYPKLTEVPEIEAEMLFISIERPYRKTGLAKEFIAAVLSAFRERGVPRTKVTTEVQNEVVNRLLVALGFHVERDFDFYGKAMRLYTYVIPAEGEPI